LKIAVVYNRESRNVINLFGVPNREKYGKETIRLITTALKRGRHQVATFEADKFLIENLEGFMPRVLKGESPGLVFNLSYGIQGQARYTHVPSILEMVGIPYTGSGPMAHSLSLDKVVAKMIFRQRGLPTPDFAVLDQPDSPLPEMEFPLIVKPKDEAVSFGLRIVHDEEELREGAGTIFENFRKPVLVEKYIDGREVNVALIGNDPPQALPPVELLFGDEGPAIYTEMDKKRTSGREVKQHCPADLPSDVLEHVQRISVEAFRALGCRDSARVDLRIDREWNCYILEINSLASLGRGGSLPLAARQVGLDYDALINRLVEVAAARYFATPTPVTLGPGKGKGEGAALFDYITGRRDRMETRLRHLCRLQSRTGDPTGARRVARDLGQTMEEIGLAPAADFTDDRTCWLWQSPRGFEGGTLLLAHSDVPLPGGTPVQSFRRSPEFLFGEGIGTSRAPLVVAEYALRALKAKRELKNMRLGLMVYADEGRGAFYSEQLIARAAAKAGRVLVLRPQTSDGQIILQRRGCVDFLLTGEGRPTKLGGTGRYQGAFAWLASRMGELAELSSRKKRLGVSITDIDLESIPLFLPHRFEAKLTVSYYAEKVLEETLVEIRKILGGVGREVDWRLERISDRPPMKGRSVNRRMAEVMEETARAWDLPFSTSTSLWPSVAGLAAPENPVLCGLGPTAEEMYTDRERIHRISLIQQTLLVAQFLYNRKFQ